MDFREFATRKAAEGHAAVDPETTTESLIVPVAGGRAFKKTMEVVIALVSGTGLLLCVAPLPLAGIGLIPERLGFGLLALGFAMTLILRKVSFWIIRRWLATRDGSLLKSCVGLPSRALSVESVSTIEQTKLFQEDQAIGLLDASGRRLVIDGCMYRYVLLGDDLRRLTTKAAFGGSGVIIEMEMGGEKVDIALINAGHGPWLSLVETLNPKAAAKQLARRVTETLLGQPLESYQAAPKPPPLPVEGPFKNNFGFCWRRFWLLARRDEGA